MANNVGWMVWRQDGTKDFNIQTKNAKENRFKRVLIRLNYCTVQMLVRAKKNRFHFKLGFRQ